MKLHDVAERHFNHESIHRIHYNLKSRILQEFREFIIKPISGNIFLGILIIMASFVFVGSYLSPVVAQSENTISLSDDPAVLAEEQSGKTRTYYLAADQVNWTYASSEMNNITGKPYEGMTKKIVESGPGTIGNTYFKAQYRQYTDETFTTLESIPSEWQHLGILGPVIRGEVGDTIKIVFKNNLNFSVSVHPHGVFYLKDSEGAPYNDGTSGKDKNDDMVAPGNTHTYIWQVPERAGPGPNDPSSIVWPYHSHTNETSQENAGLIGPLIITRQGMANPDGSPGGVDREFVTLFTVFDENTSPFMEQNMETFMNATSSVNKTESNMSTDSMSMNGNMSMNSNMQRSVNMDSNMKHSINGFIFGSMPGLNMMQGEKVRWYVMGMGGEMDMHTAHWHGQTLLWNGMRVDTIEVLPATTRVLDMVPDNPDIWLFHCHVNEHIDNGMEVLFEVVPSNTTDTS